jgi:hypothetical protein
MIRKNPVDFKGIHERTKNIINKKDNVSCNLLLPDKNKNAGGVDLAERKGVSAMAYSMRLVKQFKNEFDQSIVKDLQSKKDRFPDCEKLIDKWNSLHVQEQSLPQDLKTLLEIANHISVANVLLEEPRAYCELMEYEVPLPGGQEKMIFDCITKNHRSIVM